MMRTTRRLSIVICLGLGVGIPRASGRGADAPRERPNVVIIVADDLGIGDLGCYGNRVVQTPRIDAFAAEGLRFTRAYAGSCASAPSRATLLTGKHTGHSPVRGATGGIPLPDVESTLAEVLRADGWTTGGFGKWGLGDRGSPGAPERQGFDVFFGYYHERDAEDYFPRVLVRNGELVSQPGNQTRRRTDYSHHAIVRETLAFVRENHDRPFFAWVAWTPPHGRYQLPADEPAHELYRDRAEWSISARVAATMITMLDRSVGELLDLLGELGIAERTLVVLVSANGPASRFEGSLESAGPYRGQKRELYEGGLRVPAIARWPGRIRSGTSDVIWFGPDLLPTVLEFAGAPGAAGPIDGRSLATHWLTDAPPPPAALYWEWPRYDWRESRYVPGGRERALRSGDWKVIQRGSDAAWELYDLAADPAEATDLAATRPEVVERLARLADAETSTMPPQDEPPRAEAAEAAARSAPTRARRRS